MQFSKYELQVIREALLSDLEYWHERQDSGGNISEKFLETLEKLEEKISNEIDQLALK